MRRGRGGKRNEQLSSSSLPRSLLLPILTPSTPSTSHPLPHTPMTQPPQRSRNQAHRKALHHHQRTPQDLFRLLLGDDPHMIARRLPRLHSHRIRQTRARHLSKSRDVGVIRILNDEVHNPFLDIKVLEQVVASRFDGDGRVGEGGGSGESKRAENERRRRGRG